MTTNSDAESVRSVSLREMADNILFEIPSLSGLGKMARKLDPEFFGDCAVRTFNDDLIAGRGEDDPEVRRLIDAFRMGIAVGRGAYMKEQEDGAS